LNNTGDPERCPLPQDVVMNAGKLLATALVAMKRSGTLPKQSWDCDAASQSNVTTGNNVGDGRLQLANDYVVRTFLMRSLSWKMILKVV